MKKTNLPPHWQIKRLGDVCKIYSGYGFPKNLQGQNDGKYPFYKVGDISRNVQKGHVYLNFCENYINEEIVDSLRMKLFPVNTVVFAKIGEALKLNRRAIMKEKGVVDNNAIGIKAREGFCEDKYLYYFMNTVKLEDYSRATTVPSVRKTDIEEIQIPIPPLPEQEQIVAKIEELFSELDAGIENIKTAHEQLKVYRQSLLNTIIKKSNFISIKNIVDKLDQGWSPRCLNKKSENNDEWAIIKTSAVQHGFFNEGENKVLPTNLIPKVQHEIKTGDILITRAGPRVRVGVCCMVRKTRPKLINCDKVYRLKLDTVKVTPEYFEMVMNAPYYMRIVESMKTGINDSGLNLTQSKFLKIKIPIPPLPEQLKIVEELESRLTVCDKLEEDIKFSLARAESLRQSILKQAFEGKLLNFKGETDK